MTAPEHVSPDTAGCWLEGSRGWTASGSLVEIAWSYGMPHDADDEAIVAAYLANEETITLSTGEVCEPHDALLDSGGMVDDAEDWMNAHIAPEGFSFGWHDGEFFLWSDQTWNEEN